MWNCQGMLICTCNSIDMVPKFLPEDLSIEDLMMYLPKDSFKICLRGTHKRNAYRDIKAVEADREGKLIINVGRNSLYNALPEYLFHPINRFDNIPEAEKKERYQEEHYKQEKEKEDAYAFFAAFDNFFLSIKTEVKQKIYNYVSENTVLQKIIGDRISPGQLANPFIKRCLPFLPKCKSIRGNRTLLKLMIQKVLREENMHVEIHSCNHSFSDSDIRYRDTLDSTLDDIYLGDGYEDVITTFDLHFWSDECCDADFAKFIDNIEEFRQFIQDYFISMEEIIRFNIVKDDSPLIISDETSYNYLNYNTNI